MLAACNGDVFGHVHLGKHGELGAEEPTLEVERGGFQAAGVRIRDVAVVESGCGVSGWVVGGGCATGNVQQGMYIKSSIIMQFKTPIRHIYLHPNTHTQTHRNGELGVSSNWRMAVNMLL